MRPDGPLAARLTHKSSRDDRVACFPRSAPGMSRSAIPCVLDTNIAGYGFRKVIEQLARSGLRLRVAETALPEWGAACARRWESGMYSRPEARLPAWASCT